MMKYIPEIHKKGWLKKIADFVEILFFPSFAYTLWQLGE